MDPTSFRSMKESFSKEWPAGCDPDMSAYKYFTRQFIEIKGFNWLLLPCVHSDGNPKHWGSFHDGSITMKFYYSGTYTAHHHPNTFERRGVMIQRESTLLHLYVDEDAKLFANKISEVAVGQLNIVRNMWNGTANVDMEYIKSETPFAIWHRNPWD